MFSVLSLKALSNVLFSIPYSCGLNSKNMDSTTYFIPCTTICIPHMNSNTNLLIVFHFWGLACVSLRSIARCQWKRYVSILLNSEPEYENRSLRCLNIISTDKTSTNGHWKFYQALCCNMAVLIIPQYNLSLIVYFYETNVFSIQTSVDYKPNLSSRNTCGNAHIVWILISLSYHYLHHYYHYYFFLNPYTI